MSAAKELGCEWRQCDTCDGAGRLTRSHYCDDTCRDLWCRDTHYESYECTDCESGEQRVIGCEVCLGCGMVGDDNCVRCDSYGEYTATAEEFDARKAAPIMIRECSTCHGQCRVSGPDDNDVDVTDNCPTCDGRGAVEAEAKPAITAWQWPDERDVVFAGDPRVDATEKLAMVRSMLARSVGECKHCNCADRSVAYIDGLTVTTSGVDALVRDYERNRGAA